MTRSPNVTPFAPLRRYPIRLEVANRTVTLRLMGGADRAALLTFTRTLYPADLLLLRSDITDPAVIETWLDQISLGRRVTLLACIDDEIVGYASLTRRYLSWMRHIGEVRVLVAESRRRRGIGTTLFAELRTLATGMGMSKLVAQIAREQAISKAAFHHFGFVMEALLADWVIDAEGHTHDLMILSQTLGDGAVGTLPRDHQALQRRP